MSMDDIVKIEVGSDEGSFAEEDWNQPEQSELPKWLQPWKQDGAGAKRQA